MANPQPIVSKANTKEFNDNYDRIFSQKNPEDERKDAMNQILETKKHVQVVDGLQTFCHDNNLVHPGTNLGYAEIESVSDDGIIKIKGCEHLWFSPLNVKLLP